MSGGDNYKTLKLPTDNRLLAEDTKSDSDASRGSHSPLAIQGSNSPSPEAHVSSTMTGFYSPCLNDVGASRLAGELETGEEREYVDPSNGQRHESDLVLEQRAEINRLKGEVETYQLRVAGVSTLGKLLTEKKHEAGMFRDKSERLEVALRKQEYKCMRLEKELREKGGSLSEDSGRRVPPVLPTSKKILNTLMQENARLKLALNSFHQKGNKGYLEALEISDLRKVVQEQASIIQNMAQRLQRIQNDVQLHASATASISKGSQPESGLGSSIESESLSSGDYMEIIRCREEISKLKERLDKRESFIEILSEKLAEYQKGEVPPPDPAPSDSDTAIDKLKETITDLEARLSKATSTAEAEKNKRIDAEREVLNLRDGYDKLCSTNENVKSELCNYKEFANRLNLEINSWKEKYTELKKKKQQSPTEDQVMRLMMTVSELEAENEKLKKDLEDIQTKYALNHSKIQDLEEIKQNLHHKDSLYRSVASENSSLRSRLNDAQATLNQARKELIYYKTQYEHFCKVLQIGTGFHLPREGGLVMPPPGQQPIVCVADSNKSSPKSCGELGGPGIPINRFEQNLVNVRGEDRLQNPSSSQPQGSGVSRAQGGIPSHSQSAGKSYEVRGQINSPQPQASHSSQMLVTHSGGPIPTGINRLTTQPHRDPRIPPTTCSNTTGSRPVFLTTTGAPSGGTYKTESTRPTSPAAVVKKSLPK